MPNSYEIDTVVQINSAFTTLVGGSPIDPTEVILFISDPCGVITEISGVALTNVSPGVFLYQTLLNQIGVWTYKWQGTGAVAVTSPDNTMIVNRTVFAPPLP